QTVAAACDKLRRKPIFEKRRACLLNLRLVLAKFDGLAQKLVISRSGLCKASRSVCISISTLGLLANEKDSEATVTENTAQIAKQALDEQTALQTTLLLDQSKHKYFVLTRTAQRADARVAESDTDIARLESEERSISAAQALDEVLALNS